MVEGLSEIGENVNESREQISGKKKSKNVSNEQIADKSQMGSGVIHAHKVLNRRNALQNRETFLPPY